MKRVKPVRTASVVVRVFPEECAILRFNAGLHGMSMSDYIRQRPAFGIRLRKRRKRNGGCVNWLASARTLNQFARWANTCKAERRKPVEVLAALAASNDVLPSSRHALRQKMPRQAEPC